MATEPSGQQEAKLRNTGGTGPAGKGADNRQSPATGQDRTAPNRLEPITTALAERMLPGGETFPWGLVDGLNCRRLRCSIPAQSSQHFRPTTAPAHPSVPADLNSLSPPALADESPQRGEVAQTSQTPSGPAWAVVDWSANDARVAILVCGGGGMDGTCWRGEHGLRRGAVRRARRGPVCRVVVQ
jgi:hypothetical protein